jgi:hypothetical protein
MPALDVPRIRAHRQPSGTLGHAVRTGDGITRFRVTTPTVAAGHTDATVNHRLRGVIQVRPLTCEISFRGQAGRTLRAQFDDCEVTTRPETTTLRAKLPDQAALPGLVERIVGLGLEIIDVHLVTQPSAP